MGTLNGQSACPEEGGVHGPNHLENYEYITINQRGRIFAFFQGVDKRLPYFKSHNGRCPLCDTNVNVQIKCHNGNGLISSIAAVANHSDLTNHYTHNFESCGPLI
jgi:hypothetical protein